MLLMLMIRPLGLILHMRKPITTKAMLLYELGRYEEVIKTYNQFIWLNPNYAIAYYNLGLALGKLGRYVEAINAYDQAIELNPQYEEAYYNKGSVLYELGRYEEEVKAYNRAIELNPQYVEAYYNKGFCFSGVRSLRRSDQCL